MAYELKYQSEFYNIYGKFVQVQLSKDNYEDSEVTDVRTSEVKIEVNYTDQNTPIIGTGATVIIENQQGYGYLDDLLTAYEREFICTIIYDNIIVFKGYSVCDLNEQNFLPISTIVVRFTDYLHRMEDYNMICLEKVNEKSTIFEMLSDVRTKIDLHPNIYVNSTLFENSMAAGATDSFMEQLYLENALYYSNEIDYDNAYDVLNKTLLSFGAFFYSYGDRWILERLEDVTRTGGWLYFVTSTTGVPVSSQMQLYNKQSGDFEYTEFSQKIAYNSGLKTLILNLREKLYESLVFNNYYPEEMDFTFDPTPEPGTLALHKWFIYDDCTALQRGTDFRGIETWLKWKINDHVTSNIPENYSTYIYGVYTTFEVQFNASEDIPTTLTINYTMTADAWGGAVESVDLQFFIRIDGGQESGRYIMAVTLEDGYVWHGIHSVLGIPIIEPSPIVSSFTTTSTFNDRDRVWQVSYTIPLTEEHVDGSDGHLMPSLWNVLGQPTTQKFILGFYPVKFHLRQGVLHLGHGYEIPDIQYIGDVSVSISSETTPNKITYSINKNFVKTEELDMTVFDLNNVNFCNGPMVDDGYGSYQKTNLWVTEHAPVAEQLMDKLGKDRFRNNFRTKHILKTTIMYDGHMKPFSVLTDDHLEDDSSNLRKMLLLGYTWDLNNGTYDIEAEEYMDLEEIIIADVVVDSSGTIEDGSSGTTVLTAPTGLTASQSAPGGNITVQWNAVTGATGYRVRRIPSWYIPMYDPDNPIWSYQEVEVYSGSNTWTIDPIDEDGTIPGEGMSVTYRVCSFNSNVSSPYSADYTTEWSW